MSAPQSTIYICSGVRVDSRYQHSIYFADKTAQENYFAGKVVKTFPACTYLRKTWPLQVTATMEQAKTWSYLYFRNGTGKMYYYFITNVEYKNDSCVVLTLELDVLQTYLFDFTLLPSFIERQHTTTDAPGSNTLDEGLDIGELITTGKAQVGKDALCIMVMCSFNPNATTKEEAQVGQYPYMYNKVFSGIKLWAIHPNDWVKWGKQLIKLDGFGVSEGIVAMWMYPLNNVILGGEDDWFNGQIAHVVERARTDDDGVVHRIESSVPSTLDGYTPKNKKLLCYPYRFMMGTGHDGNTAVYRYERFKDGVMGFKLSGNLSPDGGIHITPQNYNGLVNNYVEGMTLTGFPTCAWSTDTYLLWLAQNQGQLTANNRNIAGKIALGAGAIVGGAVASLTGVGAIPGLGGVGAGIGMVKSGIQDIQALMGQHQDRDLEPAQAKGNFSSAVNITNGEHCFNFYHRSVTAEVARTLDDYFTMHGYKLNRVEVPNLTARPHYTFIKTVGCNLTGNLCNEDLVKIGSIFDQGVTWWKNGDNIGNYTLNNAV